MVAADPSRDATGRVLVYKLGASKALPAPTPRVSALPELPDLPTTSAQEARGAVLYAERCAWCHGTAVQGTGAVPDLRYATRETHASWDAIVLDGAYVPKGMPVFGEVLTEEDARAIQAYVLQRARALRGP